MIDVGEGEGGTYRLNPATGPQAYPEKTSFGLSLIGASTKEFHLSALPCHLCTEKLMQSRCCFLTGTYSIRNVNREEPATVV
jgi:hypothetical protein